MKKVDKDCNEKVNSISYKVKFIDGMRFMPASLSNLIDNLAEWIHKIRCKDYDFFSSVWTCQGWFDKRKHLSFLTMISINLFCC